MPVAVSPETFLYVEYDAAEIRRIADELIEELDIGEVDLSIDIDETSPLGRVKVDIDGTKIVIEAESGAFENFREPRHMSEDATRSTLGRALLRARDRMTGGFGEAPSDSDLTLHHSAAWETYCVGRMQRAGYEQNRQRWLYNFRNRHRFDDASDATFEKIWNSDQLTWGQLAALSDEAASD